jgi:hypothetical protein
MIVLVKLRRAAMRFALGTAMTLFMGAPANAIGVTPTHA